MFFNWCLNKRYCAENPVETFDPIKIDRKGVGILGNQQVVNLLRAAPEFKGGSLVPFVALSLFAGLRRGELERLTWDHFYLSESDGEAHTIHVTADVSKTRQGTRSIRDIEVSSNLMDWIEPHLLKRTPIVGANFRRDFEALREKAGLTWKNDKREIEGWVPDLLRHTAVSNHIAEHQHEGKTALWAGNSPDIIHAHYRKIVKRREAQVFWEITPAELEKKPVSISA